MSVNVISNILDLCNYCQIEVLINKKNKLEHYILYSHVNNHTIHNYLPIFVKDIYCEQHRRYLRQKLNLFPKEKED
jgi:hypothetical protein